MVWYFFSASTCIFAIGEICFAIIGKMSKAQVNEKESDLVIKGFMTKTPLDSQNWGAVLQDLKINPSLK